MFFCFNNVVAVVPVADVFQAVADGDLKTLQLCDFSVSQEMLYLAARAGNEDPGRWKQIGLFGKIIRCLMVMICDGGKSTFSNITVITKASLLAGVRFPLGMYWGQSFWRRSDLSHRNVPFKWFNHLILTPPPGRVQLPVGPWSSELFWITFSLSCA